MDWNDSPEQAAFRAEVRTFIESDVPAPYRAANTVSPQLAFSEDRFSADEARRGTSDAWVESLADRGWIAPAPLSLHLRDLGDRLGRPGD